jgi:hypothetical protein
MHDSDGDITALASFMERVFIFKRRRIYVLSGDGPDDTGGGVFPVPELISEQIGCVDMRSVCVIPEGVLFCAETGIHIVDGGGRVEEIGAPINAALRALFTEGNPVRIAGARRIPNTHLVAIAPAANGGSPAGARPCLFVWDRRRGTWQTWSTGYGNYLNGNWPAMGVDAGTLYYTDGNTGAHGTLQKYTHALAAQSDDEDTIPTTRAWSCYYRTGWISAPQVGDFARLYRVDLRVKIGDYPAVDRLVYWTIETDVASGGSSGGVLTEGLTTTLTGTRDNYEGVTVSARPKYQKGNKFRITIEIASGTTAVKGLEVCGLDLVFGGKGGLQRVPVANVGT